jgi:sulfur-carrier protein
MAKVWIPSLMRDLTGGQTVVTVKGATVRQIVENLEAAYPGAKKRLVAGDSLKPGIGVAIDGEMARYGLTEKVKASSEVHFLPAVSGGSYR